MPASRLSVGVLISGSGSNLQALIDACNVPDFPAAIACVISNKADAYGLTRASQANIPTHVISHKDFSTRETFDQAMDSVLKQHKVDLVCLAGFMRIVTPWFVEQWFNRLINIHPSLLPAFKGAHAQRDALEAGVTIAGCTVHFVRNDMDSGPIIIQGAVPVEMNDTEDSLRNRILQMEHQIYPEALRWIAEKKVTIEGDLLHITDAVKRGRWSD